MKILFRRGNLAKSAIFQDRDEMSANLAIARLFSGRIDLCTLNFLITIRLNPVFSGIFDTHRQVSPDWTSLVVGYTSWVL